MYLSFWKLLHTYLKTRGFQMQLIYSTVGTTFSEIQNLIFNFLILLEQFQHISNPIYWLNYVLKPLSRNQPTFTLNDHLLWLQRVERGLIVVSVRRPFPPFLVNWISHSSLSLCYLSFPHLFLLLPHVLYSPNSAVVSARQYK